MLPRKGYVDVVNVAGCVAALPEEVTYSRPKTNVNVQNNVLLENMRLFVISSS